MIHACCTCTTWCLMFETTFFIFNTPLISIVYASTDIMSVLHHVFIDVMRIFYYTIIKNFILRSLQSLYAINKFSLFIQEFRIRANFCRHELCFFSPLFSIVECSNFHVICRFLSSCSLLYKLYICKRSR